VNSIERDPAVASPPPVPRSDTLDTGMASSAIPVAADADAPAQAAAGRRRASRGWARLLAWVGLSADADAAIADLSASIADEPDAPMNYVLRGEALLRSGALDAARSDFERALALAERALRGERWGLIAQAAQDRAAAGLIEVLRRSGESVDEARARLDARPVEPAR
jgi:tetratricopeptide (TPR) repeat protein